MKIVVAKSALLEGLQIVQNVVGVRTTLPILLNVLVTADKNKLWLTTTDLDVTVRCAVDAQVHKAGATTLPVRRLFNIVRELAEADIEIAVDDKNVATVTCSSSYFKLNGLSEDEFPPLAKPEGKFTYTLEQGAFKEMLKKTAYAASTDETRFVLNGCLMSFKDGKLTIVATDGRRLALVEQELEFPKEAETDVIVPTKAVAELLRILKDEGELKVSRKDNQILFEFSDILIASKLIEGTYPNYRQVIPSHCEERVAIEREAYLTALRRVSLLTTDKSNATKLTFAKNKLVISLNTPDVGEARETLPVKYTGKEISIAFNPEFMMDPLKSLASDEVAMELTDDLSPGVLKSDIPFLYVIMPMRVS
jgi:DNA polymerase III subunit beta